MYKLYIKYNENGKIIAKLSIPSEDVAPIIEAKEDNEFYKEVTDSEFNSIDETFYVNSAVNTIVSRPRMEISQEGSSFSNVPISAEGTTVSINGTVYQVDDSFVQLNIDTPGSYKVIFKAFPYMDEVFLVTV
jgi:hypothetical protein